MYSSLGGKGSQFLCGLRDHLIHWQRTDPTHSWIRHFCHPSPADAHITCPQHMWWNTPKVPASQETSHRMRRTADSLGWEPAVPILWEAKSQINCNLFSFSTQPSLDSVTHQWAAVTSDQILFGVLLLKKIIFQPWRLIWFLENTILIFFSLPFC